MTTRALEEAEAGGPPAAPDPLAVREAFTLPLLLLTVAFAGGLRVGAEGLRLLPPPLVSLVLAVFLLALIIRSGLLDPALVVGPRRGGLANASGAMVLAALFAASAQVLNALAPETGLLHVFFYAAFAGLFWTSLAAQPDARRLLRSLFVIFGWAFVLRHVLVAGLRSPEPGLARRLAGAVFDGLTLGALDVPAWSPATGYIAFATVGLYLVALFMLPRAAPRATASLVRVD